MKMSIKIGVVLLAVIAGSATNGMGQVFKYPPPGKLNVSPMRVYLMPDLWSFTTYNFKTTKLVGNPTEGSGEGLEVQLNPRQPYYFASADGNG
ncbi:hypothetical protein K1719_043725 [Acacia pycnantha]|nr:hypothetical protein K1719_043725 [Acacia pycnantha]